MKPHSSEKLAIRVRRIATGNGEGSATLTVYCTDREASVPLTECETCASCEGMTLDPSGRESFLMCRRASANPAAPAVWSRVVKKILPAAAAQTTIGEVMTRDVICVTSDVSVEGLTTLLLERGISGAPVVDDDGHPLGMVSKTDLLRQRHDEGNDESLELRTAELEIELGPGFHTERIARALVSDLMTPVAFSLEETAPLAYAAAMMATEGVHRIPVVDSDGRVVGILSALDVLRWLAEETGGLAKG